MIVVTEYNETIKLLQSTDLVRTRVSQRLDQEGRPSLGQYMTPSTLAAHMSSLFRFDDQPIRLLDPGAGVGSLTAAFVSTLLNSGAKPDSIHVDAVELDGEMILGLHETLGLCREACRDAGIVFTSDIIQMDYLERSANTCLHGTAEYTHCIMNPPYRKIRSDSKERALLRKHGLETSNLYTAFMAMAASQLTTGGQLVSITPRSFCSGSYFRAFRKYFFDLMALQRVDTFESRDALFSDDGVLQENVILHGVRGPAQGSIVIANWQKEGPHQHSLEYSAVLDPSDKERLVHLPANEEACKIAQSMSSLECTLDDLGLRASTGRVVDFRARDLLRNKADANCHPLVYACHFKDGYLSWPNDTGRKPNGLLKGAESERLIVEQGWYVLTKRFSSKEERRRVVAVVCHPHDLPDTPYGFENHLNYYHENGRPLSKEIAIGLCNYLNTTFVDQFFRQFNGHTQVNSGDLRVIRYPSRGQLALVAETFEGEVEADQDRLDQIMHGLLGIPCNTCNTSAR